MRRTEITRVGGSAGVRAPGHRAGGGGPRKNRSQESRCDQIIRDSQGLMDDGSLPRQSRKTKLNALKLSCKRTRSHRKLQNVNVFYTNRSDSDMFVSTVDQQLTGIKEKGKENSSLRLFIQFKSGIQFGSGPAPPPNRKSVQSFHE